MMRALDATGCAERARGDASRPACRSSASASACRRCSKASEEAPALAGLGLFAGTVKRFPAGARVPHMGWNESGSRADSRLLAGIGAEPYVYFAHSYYVPLHPRHRGHLHVHTALHGGCSNAATSSACSFTRRSPGPLGLQIVKNFVEL